MQAVALKAIKATLPNNKAKKTAAVPPSTPAQPSTTTPVKQSPGVVKNEATFAASSATSNPKSTQKDAVVIDLDPIAEPVKEQITSVAHCLSCNIPAESQTLLEEHIIAKHANEPDVCLNCGFKAHSKHSLSDHQSKTGHIKTRLAESAEADDGDDELTSEVSASPSKPTTGKGKKVSSKAFKCPQCSFCGATKHGLNLHSQRCHPSPKPSPDPERNNPPSQNKKSEPARIFYKCHYCGVSGIIKAHFFQSYSSRCLLLVVSIGTLDELKEHSKALHPNLTAKLFRLTSTKSRPSVNQLKGPGVDETTEEPPIKKSRTETTVVSHADNAGQSTSSVSESEPPKTATKKIASSSTASSRQPVFVVASPPPPPPTPSYTCVCCMSRFFKESEVRND